MIKFSRILIIFFIFLLTSFGFGDEIWTEDFSSYTDGTGLDGTGNLGDYPSGVSKWSIDISNCGLLNDADWCKIVSGVFEMRDVRGTQQSNGTGEGAIWTSEQITISGYNNVAISIDITESGGWEDPDFIKAWYQVDSEDTTRFGFHFDDFTSDIFTASGLSGSNLTIFIEVDTRGVNEIGKFDNISVTGDPVGGVSSPTGFTATTISKSQIDLSWTQNSNTDNVMVAYNTTNTFGTPSGSYSVNDVISGGGTVIFNANGEAYNHTSLNANTTFYYRAWSVDGVAYSPPTDAEASTMKNEPENHVSSFDTGTMTTTSINLTWTDATGTYLPEKYLVVAKKETGSFPSIADGTPVADDSDWSDNNAALNVDHSGGANQCTFSNLSIDVEYTFAIYPYVNSDSDIDYKTDGIIPEVLGEIRVGETFWSEDFSSYTDGTGLDGTGILGDYPSGVSKWSIDISNCDLQDNKDWCKVVSGVFEMRDVHGTQQSNGTGSGAIWTSEEIYIAGYNNVSISMDVSESGNWEDGDFIKASYKIDSGDINQFGFLYDDYTSDSFSILGLSGSNLTIYVEVDNLGGQEIGAFDNVIVAGDPIGGVSAPTDFDTTSVSASQIDLSWTKNSSNNDVVVAWNTTDSFGDPQNGTAYTSGNSIGDATVLYNGSGTSTSHLSLDGNTTYYYRAWSVNSSVEYSPAAIADATTLKGDPSEHVTGFDSGTLKISSIELIWTGSVGSTLPDNYLVLAKKGSGSYASVNDGVPIADDSDWSDDNGAINVEHVAGSNSCVFSNLDTDTEYSFIIYPYVYSGSKINFKTDGTIPTLTKTISIGDTFWLEDFSTCTEGTGVDAFGSLGDYPVGVSWTVDISNCNLIDTDDYGKVVNGAFEFKDVVGTQQPNGTGVGAIWTSETINIAGYTNVSISMDVSETGNWEDLDFIKASYKIDSGDLTPFGFLYDDYTSDVFSVLDLSGNNLTIYVEVDNLGGAEIGRFDNINVAGDPKTGVADPTDFVATSISDSQIDLAWALNTNSNNVMVAWNLSDTFGEPSGTYIVGASISGGGTVLYNGSGTSESHTSLDRGTTYYYKAWSVDGTNTYSYGVTSDASTIKQEPTNHVTNISSGSITCASIELTWTGSTGDIIPDYYLVMAKTGSGTYSSVADGTPVAGDFDWSDNNAALNIEHSTGVNSCTFDNLSHETDYDFIIYPYSNVGSEINYKDSPTPITTMISSGQIPPLMISEIADPDDDSNGRFVEIFNNSGQDISFTNQTWYLSRCVQNGNWKNVQLSGSIAPGETYLIAYDQSGFTNAFGFEADLYDGSVPRGDGDDSYILYFGGDNTTGVLVDIYGEIGVDGTGTAWDYSGGHAERNNSASQPNSTWTASEWTITAPANISDMGPNDSSLPVTLSSFDAQYNRGQVVLTWSTESEVSNLGFNIYRSQYRYKDFEKINSELIPGARNSSEKHDYQYIDTKILKGVKYFYQLEDVSTLGEVEKHSIISIIAQVAENPITIASEYILYPAYPNPFNPTTNFKLNIYEDAQVNLRIYNVTGKLVNILVNSHLNRGVYTYTWNGTDSHGVQIASGVYFVHMIIGNSTSKLQKVLLVR